MRKKAQIRTKKIFNFQALVKPRRAQIRMSETIAVMFIFFILVVFGIIFFYKYSQVAYNEEQEELLGIKAVEITLKTLYLPELICSNGEAEPDYNCFDLMKLRQVNKTFSQHFEYYHDLFPYSRIMVEQLYPVYENWTLYNKPKMKKLENGSVIEEEEKKPVHLVVALKDESREGIYSFGVLTVEVYP